MEQMATTFEQQASFEEQERAAQYAAQMAVAGASVRERWDAPINIQDSETYRNGRRLLEDAAYMAGGGESPDAAIGIAIAIYAAAHEDGGAERIMQRLEEARLKQPVDERVQGPMLPAAMLEQAVADRLQFSSVAAMVEESRLMFEREQYDLLNQQADEDGIDIFGRKKKKKTRAA